MYQLLFFILFSTSVSVYILWEGCPLPVDCGICRSEAISSSDVRDSTAAENEVDSFCWCQKVNDNNNFADFQVQSYS